MPLIDEIVPKKSVSLTDVDFSPLIISLLLAVLIKFSYAEILSLALTPLFKSTNSLFFASKPICSTKSLAISGIYIFSKESSFMFLDSPNTTTSTNYKIQCFTHSSGSSLFINRPQNDDNSSYIGRFSSNIIAMEVTP